MNQELGLLGLVFLLGGLLLGLVHFATEYAMPEAIPEKLSVSCCKEVSKCK